jgi:hypothetical protein
MGINFTCVSYTDHVDVGIAVSPQLVPEPWSIIDGMQSALSAYLKLARGHRAAGSTKGGTRRKTARKKTQARSKVTTKPGATAGKKAPVRKTSTRAARKR